MNAGYDLLPNHMVIVGLSVLENGELLIELFPLDSRNGNKTLEPFLL